MKCARRHDLLAWADAVGRARESAGGLVELHAVGLAAGRASTCAIDQEGAIWCWGQVGKDMFAVPHRIDVDQPARAIDGTTAFDAGYAALLADGSVFRFGRDIGDDYRLTFSRPPTALVMSQSIALVRLEDGAYACDDGDAPCRNHGESVGDGARLCLDGLHGSVVSAPGDCHGKYDHVARIVELGPRIRVCGDTRPWPDDCGDDLVQRVTTELDVCELRTDGAVRCAGGHTDWLSGVLGIPRPADDDPRVPIPLPEPAAAIAAGSHHLCALGRSGRVLCWGHNERGQAGIGPVGVDVAPAPVAGLRDVIKIDAFDTTVCALDRRGDVWCWGAAPDRARYPVNACTPHVAAPTRFGHTRRPSRVEYLVADRHDVCLGFAGGRERCFDARRREFDHDPDEFFLRERPRCAVWNDRGVVCGHTDPAPVPGVESATDVTTGSRVACAILYDGTVTCWGGERRGELGRGYLAEVLTPQVVAIPERAP
jgi:hypothetical protein